MKALLAIFAFSLTCTNLLSAKELTVDYFTDYLTKARNLKDDQKRLANYDKLADYLVSTKKANEKPATLTQPSSPNAKGKWDISEDISPIDDSKTVVLMLKTESYPTAHLILRKEEGKLESYVLTDDFIGIRGVRVTTRVDKKKPVKRTWHSSNDGKAVFHPNPHVLLKVLRKHKKLVVQLTPYSSGTKNYIFDLTGLDNIADKLK